MANLFLSQSKGINTTDGHKMYMSMSLNSSKVWFSKMRLGEVLAEVLMNIYALWVVTPC